MNFQETLKFNILCYISKAKNEGTSAMGLDNLFQCVRPPNQNLKGAPLGVNSRYYYRVMFNDICKKNRTISRFILK